MKACISHCVALGLVLAIGAATASAASVEYRLVDDGPGLFKVTAIVTGDDHAGLAGYGLDLLGSITSLQHLSPSSIEGQTATATGPAGFTLARSRDNVPYVRGIFDPLSESIPIYGFGTRGSSFAAEGITTIASSRSNEWEAELLLARGAYTGSFESLAFNHGGPNAGAVVFNALGQTKMRMPEDLSFYRVYADSTAERTAWLHNGILQPGAQPFPGPGGPPNPLPNPIPNPLPNPVPNPLPNPTPNPPPVIDPNPLPPLPADAATVEFRLVYTGPDSFKITATANGGGHAGLSGYGLDLTGNITSLQHLSPHSAEAQQNESVGPTGFTLARSGDDATFIRGMQNIVDPNLVPIYGLGTRASSYEAEGITPLNIPDLTEWDAELVLATGTYQGSFYDLGMNPAGPNFGANLFRGMGSSSVRQPDVLSLLRVAGDTSEVLALIDQRDQHPVLPPVDPPVLPPVGPPDPTPGPPDPTPGPPPEEPQDPPTPPLPPDDPLPGVPQPFIYFHPDIYELFKENPLIDLGDLIAVDVNMPEVEMPLITWREVGLVDGIPTFVQHSAAYDLDDGMLALAAESFHLLNALGLAASPVIPEPSSAALVALALGGAARRLRRVTARRRRAAGAPRLSATPLA